MPQEYGDWFLAEELSLLPFVVGSFAFIFVKAMGTYARLTPFEVGQIKAHMYHELGAAAVSRIVVKQDGKTHPSEHGVKDAIDKLRSDPKWRGARESGTLCPSWPSQAWLTRGGKVLPYRWELRAWLCKQDS